ncbi:MAG: hypothetical protein V4565_08515 [Bacteroidota bacterium]
MQKLHQQLEKAYIDKLNYLIDANKMDNAIIKSKCSVIKANIDRFKETTDMILDAKQEEVARKDFKELLDWINALK